RHVVAQLTEKLDRNLHIGRTQLTNMHGVLTPKRTTRRAAARCNPIATAQDAVVAMAGEGDGYIARRSSLKFCWVLCMPRVGLFIGVCTSKNHCLIERVPDNL